jgi:hypothetical protein
LHPFISFIVENITLFLATIKQTSSKHATLTAAILINPPATTDFQSRKTRKKKAACILFFQSNN